MLKSTEERLTVVDVGASRGEFAEYVSRTGNCIVYAVEPLPDIAGAITRNTGIHVECCAIRDTDQPSFDMILRRSFSELSSFLNRNPSVDSKLWEHHLSGEEVISSIKVPIESLEHLLKRLGIQRVDFLKIDAQGLDLEVLRSARSKLCDISVVVLEIPYVEDSALYCGEAGITSALSSVSEMGFFPVRIVPNGAGEANLFLCNKSIKLGTFFAIEEALNIGECPVLKVCPPRLSRSKQAYTCARTKILGLPRQRTSIGRLWDRILRRRGRQDSR